MKKYFEINQQCQRFNQLLSKSNSKKRIDMIIKNATPSRIDQIINFTSDLLSLIYKNTLQSLVQIISVSVLGLPETISFDINKSIFQNQQYMNIAFSALDIYASSNPIAKNLISLFKIIYEQNVNQTNRSKQSIITTKQKIKNMSIHQFELFYQKSNSSFEMFVNQSIDRIFNSFFDKHQNNKQILEQTKSIADCAFIQTDNTIKHTKKSLHKHLKRKIAVYRNIIDRVYPNQLSKRAEYDQKPSIKDMDTYGGMFSVMALMIECCKTEEKDQFRSDLEIKMNKMNEYDLPLLMIFDLIEDVVQYIKCAGSGEIEFGESVHIIQKIILGAQKSQCSKQMKLYVEILFVDLFEEKLFNKQMEPLETINFIIESVLLCSKNDWITKFKSQLLNHSMNKFPLKTLEQICNKVKN